MGECQDKAFSLYVLLITETTIYITVLLCWFFWIYHYDQTLKQTWTNRTSKWTFWWIKERKLKDYLENSFLSFRFLTLYKQTNNHSLYRRLASNLVNTNNEEKYYHRRKLFIFFELIPYSSAEVHNHIARILTFQFRRNFTMYGNFFFIALFKLFSRMKFWRYFSWQKLLTYSKY